MAASWSGDSRGCSNQPGGSICELSWQEGGRVKGNWHLGPAEESHRGWSSRPFQQRALAAWFFSGNPCFHTLGFPARSELTLGSQAWSRTAPSLLQGKSSPIRRKGKGLKFIETSHLFIETSNLLRSQIPERTLEIQLHFLLQGTELRAHPHRFSFCFPALKFDQFSLQHMSVQNMIQTKA